MLASLLVNLSGLRQFLDPASGSYVEGLGFLAGLLQAGQGRGMCVRLCAAVRLPPRLRDAVQCRLPNTLLHPND